jgi:hypothetical protein
LEGQTKELLQIGRERHMALGGDNAKKKTNKTPSIF